MQYDQKVFDKIDMQLKAQASTSLDKQEMRYRLYFVTEKRM